jgi:hypothetical protein
MYSAMRSTAVDEGETNSTASKASEMTDSHSQRLLSAPVNRKRLRQKSSRPAGSAFITRRTNAP